MTAWTAERRQKHAEAIRQWKPWAKSTGPRTASGKARSAQNAYKHGGRAVHTRLMHEALMAQNRCLRLADMLANIMKLRGYKNPPNELLARLRADFLRHERIFYIRFVQALEYERLCKKLAFSAHHRQIVNANDN